VTRDDVHALLMSFPGAETAVSYGHPSYKVRGKFFTWFWPDAPDCLVVQLDSIDQRDMLAEAEPETFVVTDHHRPHPIVLARIQNIHPEWLRSALTRRWRKIAPASLRKAHPALNEEEPDV
jgi:hypothetical protein